MWGLEVQFRVQGCRVQRLGFRFGFRGRGCLVVYAGFGCENEAVPRGHHKARIRHGRLANLPRSCGLPGKRLQAIKKINAEPMVEAQVKQGTSKLTCNDARSFA